MNGSDEIRPIREPGGSHDPVRKRYGPRNVTFKRISWGAVFAGVVIALVTMLLLNMLGLGIGAGAINPNQENPFAGIGTGAIVWWIVSLLISMFVGGWVSGRLAGIPRTQDSVLHGLLSYAVFTLFSVFLLTSAVGSVISGVGSVISTTLSVAAKGVEKAAPAVANVVQGQLAQNGVDLGTLKQDARDLLRDTGKPELQPENMRQQGSVAGNNAQKSMKQAAENPGQAGDIADSLVDRLFNRGQNIASAADRDAVVNVIMKRTGKSREEANQIVDRWENTFNQVKVKADSLKQEAGQKARVVGNDVASAISKASIFGFIGLVLSAAAAGFGGKVGEPHDTAPAEIPTPPTA